MRAAPPVELLLSPGRLERGLVSACHAATGMVLAAWIGSWCWPGASVAVAVGSVLSGAGLLGWLGFWYATSLLPRQPEHLGWTGQAWFMRDPGAGPRPLRAVEVRIDLGQWLLLRCQPAQGAPCWRVASVRHDPLAWHLWRVALQAHGGTAERAAVGERPP